MRELVEEFAELRAKKEEFAKQTKEVNEKLDALQERIIEAMVNDGISTVIFNGIGRITLSVSQFPRVKNSDQFFNYLRSCGHGDIIKETVHSSTLRGYWNNLRATQGNTPEPNKIGLEVYTENTVSLTKQ